MSEGNGKSRNSLHARLLEYWREHPDEFALLHESVKPVQQGSTTSFVPEKNDREIVPIAPGSADLVDAEFMPIGLSPPNEPVPFFSCDPSEAPTRTVTVHFMCGHVATIPHVDVKQSIKPSAHCPLCRGIAGVKEVT